MSRLADQLLNHDEEKEKTDKKPDVKWWEFLTIFVLIIPGFILFVLGFIVGNLVEVTRHGYDFGAHEWFMRNKK